jgi:CheY-like chemotaxis protein
MDRPLVNCCRNLVVNAIKFTKSGSVTVSAKLAQDNPKHMRLTVTDTGIGIPRDRRHAIFEPFVQADGSLTREFGGTGLSLTISRQIAEARGGSLTVSSELGQGSVFVCEIETGLNVELDQTDNSPEHRETPTEEVTRIAERRPLPAAAQKNTTPVADHSLELDQLSDRILVVDDGNANRRLVSLTLRKSGAFVVEAENGQEALDILSREQFDLVVMDMQMPILDGYAATRELRRRGASLPIIAVTAHAMKGDRDKCEAPRCSDYLTKPVTPHDLVTAVSNAMAAAGDSAGNVTHLDD